VNDAWKLRALVYGLLAVVAALVLGNLPSSRHLHTLNGSTAGGGQVRLELDGRHVRSLKVWHVPVGCTVGHILWTPVADQSNVRIRETGSGFSVHELPDSRVNTPGLRQNAWMHGRMSSDAHRIEGDITYVESGARGKCGSGPIRFSASR
jgi:hypothetical protein